AVIAAAGESELVALESSGPFGWDAPAETSQPEADGIADALARAEMLRRAKLEEARARAAVVPQHEPEPLLVEPRPSALPELESGVRREAAERVGVSDGVGGDGARRAGSGSKRVGTRPRGQGFDGVMGPRAGAARLELDSPVLELPLDAIVEQAPTEPSVD